MHLFSDRCLLLGQRPVWLRFSLLEFPRCVLFPAWHLFRFLFLWSGWGLRPFCFLRRAARMLAGGEAHCQFLSAQGIPQCFGFLLHPALMCRRYRPTDMSRIAVKCACHHRKRRHCSFCGHAMFCHASCAAATVVSLRTLTVCSVHLLCVCASGFILSSSEPACL